VTGIALAPAAWGGGFAPGSAGLGDPFFPTAGNGGYDVEHYALLRQELGNDTFEAILRAWTDRFAYGNATTDDFTALAEEVSGASLDTLFDAWLFEPGKPPPP
jgi:CubicO group peptidase (beta-lactamase class C family)